MLTELLVIEPKLIHKVGCHLLDLIVREGLRRAKFIIFKGDVIKKKRLQ